MLSQMNKLRTRHRLLPIRAIVFLGLVIGMTVWIASAPRLGAIGDLLCIFLIASFVLYVERSKSAGRNRGYETPVTINKLRECHCPLLIGITAAWGLIFGLTVGITSAPLLGVVTAVLGTAAVSALILYITSSDSTDVTR